MHFASTVLFCDEAIFSREGVLNAHNAHMWALSNTHSTQPRAAQQSFTVNVWASIMVYNLLGSYILLPRLDSDKYLVFLQEVLSELLTDVLTPVRRRMWFQQDGASSQYGRCVLDHLERTFPNRWIARGGPVTWLSRPLIQLFWIFSPGYYEEPCVQHSR
ncbi:transposable element Tcb1 transposase [Trichonephila clavata]|uniref:Transposable element Tcb1 transposase n=1 Tax=Trichonephila clavata TaxID=2740835 RepID=A0A8X6F6C6_TRICU|nr:transposable element Tcb1 transposase [Trichonephila clavata]